MNGKLFPPALLLAAGLPLSAIADEAQPASPSSIKLEQKLPVGKVVSQSTEVSQVIGQPMKGSMSIKTVSRTAFHPAEDGKTRAVLKYTDAKMRLDMGGLKLDFGDAKEAGNPFEDLLDKDVTILLGPDNTIESIDGADDLLGEGLQPHLAQFKHLFDEAQIKNTFSQYLLQGVPNKELKIGDSWPIQREVPLSQGMGSLTLKLTCTLTGFAPIDGHPCAVIGLKGTSEGEIGTGNAGDQSAQGPLANFAIKVQNAVYEGTIHFDNTLGMPRKSDVESNLTMKMEVGGQAFQVDVHQKTVTAVTKVEAIDK